MFDKLDNRYCLSGKLTVTGGVHVGGGVSTGTVDMAVVRRRAGQPYVPGSSLRGVLRSAVERTLATLEPGRGCMLFDKASHDYCPTVRESARLKIQALVDSNRLDDARQTLLGDRQAEGQLCDICRLFGSPFVASKLKFSDLPAVGNPGANTRHGVGIDRDTGAARENIKFELEVVEGSSAGLAFSFALMGENLQRVPAGNPDFALLGLALKSISQGLTVGGKTGSGLGSCRLQIEKVRYFDNLGDHGLLQFLEAKPDDDPYATMTLPEFHTLVYGQMRTYLGMEVVHA